MWFKDWQQYILVDGRDGCRGRSEQLSSHTTCWEHGLMWFKDWQQYVLVDGRDGCSQVAPNTFALTLHAEIYILLLIFVCQNVKYMQRHTRKVTKQKTIHKFLFIFIFENKMAKVHTKSYKTTHTCQLLTSDTQIRIHNKKKSCYNLFTHS